MLQILILLLLAPTDFKNIPESKLMVNDPRAATAVTDKYLLPTRAADCRTEAEVQRAVEQVRSGERGECWVRDVRAFNRH